MICLQLAWYIHYRRKNEIKSLEERQQKDNQSRIMDIAKLDGKLDSENAAREAITLSPPSGVIDSVEGVEPASHKLII